MLHARCRILHFDVRKRVSPALVADQQGIALRIISRPGRALHDGDLAAIGVLAVARGDAFRHDGASRVFADVDHLRAGVRLLVIIGERDGVEFANRVVSLQDAARIFPSDGGAGFNLCPGNLGILAAASAALGDEIVDSTLAVLIARIPILNCGVLDLSVIESDQFNHGGVKLVFVANRRRASFEVTDGSAFVGNDQGAFELAGFRGVDAEVGRELHRTAHALGHVDKRSIGEDSRIERGEEIVGVGNDAAQILLY